VANHKQRPEAAQGLWIAATTYQEVGLFSEAAGYHAMIAEYWPKSDHHKDAAFNAVLLRATVGEHDKAIDSGEKFKRLYPKDELGDEVTFLMGKAHEKAGKLKDAEKLYDRYSRSARSLDAQVEALVRLAIVRKADERGASGSLDRAVQIYSQRKGQLGPRGKYWAAKARYMQGEAILARYEAVKIEGDVKQLKSRLKKKSELLKKAADAFLSTAEMGVAEWTTAALYQIGFTYESFTKALLTSPPPAGLSDADKELYTMSIEEFVVPIEERGLEAYESGWKKALELGIFNEWTAKMREALGRLNSELYPPLREIGFVLRSRGPLPLPPLIPGLRRSDKGQSQAYLMPARPESNSAGDKQDSQGEAEKEGKKP
jgi:tetratricopeptide (TPR) repeat protein